MKKENKNQKEMMLIIRNFDVKNGRLPEVEELCSITKKTEVAVKRILSGVEIYPKEMLLMANEKLVLSIYREGLLLVDIANMTGLCESTISKTMKRLSDKGFVDYRKRRYKKRESQDVEEDKKPFLAVEGGPFNGCRGYIKEYGIYATCDLWNDGNFIENAKVHRDYVRETRRRA